MIGIARSRFDRGAIRGLYGFGPSRQWGTVVRHVRDALHLGGYKPVGHELTDVVLRAWLYDGSVPSEAKISRFLLRIDTASAIEECGKRTCKLFWGDEGLCDALLRHQAAVNEACAMDGWDERLSCLSRVLGGRHVDAGMFEVREASPTGFRRLTENDLKHPVEMGTLCSSKKRLQSLRTTKDAEILQFQEDCKSIFNYSWFSQKYRDVVLGAMGVDVCPYCNRQCISAWGNKRRRSTADIDHFYSKERFPYLALSLFNFVPSCQICNSRFKLARDFYVKPHANPHTGGFGRRARFEVDDVDALIDLAPEPVDERDAGHPRAKLLSLHNDSSAEDIANSIDTFQLDELYAEHDDYAKEIIRKARIFGESQIDEYLSEYGGMFSSREELYRTLYGNYLDEEDQGRRPLAKLTQDLLRDLGVQFGGFSS